MYFKILYAIFIVFAYVARQAIIKWSTVYINVYYFGGKEWKVLSSLIILF